MAHYIQKSYPKKLPTKLSLSFAIMISQKHQQSNAYFPYMIALLRQNALLESIPNSYPKFLFISHTNQCLLFKNAKYRL